MHAAGGGRGGSDPGRRHSFGLKHDMPLLTFFSGKLAVEYCMIEPALQYEKQEVQREKKRARAEVIRCLFMQSCMRCVLCCGIQGILTEDEKHRRS